jgi:hypothetical protein
MRNARVFLGALGLTVGVLLFIYTRNPYTILICALPIFFVFFLKNSSKSYLLLSLFFLAAAFSDLPTPIFAKLCQVRH